MRASVKKYYVGLNPDFRFRGEEQTRIETLSDAAFALAITLLLISTSSSRNFRELLDFTNELIPFALCIAPIMLVWYQHFVFFLRYGLRDRTIVVLNTLLLFILLFYVYPLKFLSKMLYYIFGWMLTGSSNLALRYRDLMADGDIGLLMIIYGCGFAGIFLVFAAMYGYASRKSQELELNTLERFLTRTAILRNMLIASIPLLSALLALMLRGNDALVGYVSGFAYFLYLPVMQFFGRWVRRRLREIPRDPFPS